MCALVDWSYELLPEAERTLFCRLGRVPLSRVARRRGDTALAINQCQEGLRLAQKLGMQLEVAASLDLLAGLACDTGRPAHGALLFAAADRIREALHMPMPAVCRQQYERDMASARAALSQAHFAATWERGRGMPLDELIDDACSLSTYEPAEAQDVSR